MNGLGIVGSRCFPNLVAVEQRVWQFADLGLEWPFVISGGARGVDTRAEVSAQAAGLRVISFRPKKLYIDGPFGIAIFDSFAGPEGSWWLHEGSDGEPVRFLDFRSAAFYRNGMIVQNAGRVVAFWDGESNGTKDSIDKALKSRKPLEVVFP